MGRGEERGEEEGFRLVVDWERRMEELEEGMHIIHHLLNCTHIRTVLTAILKTGMK